MTIKRERDGDAVTIPACDGKSIAAPPHVAPNRYDFTIVDLRRSSPIWGHQELILAHYTVNAFVIYRGQSRVAAISV
jgi:hypothetical protein